MDSGNEIDHEKYENRLKSYIAWPNECPALIKELSEAGFYFSGEGDFVTCFVCGIKIGGWKDDDVPLDRHEAANKRCKYLSDRETKRKQQNGEDGVEEESSLNSDEDDKSDFGFDYLEQREKSIKSMFPSLLFDKMKEIAKAGLFYNRSRKLFECYCCHAQFEEEELFGCNDTIIFHTEMQPKCKHIAILMEDQKCNYTNELEEADDFTSPGKIEAPSTEVRLLRQRANEKATEQTEILTEMFQKTNRADQAKREPPQTKNSERTNELRLKIPASGEEVGMAQRMPISPGIRAEKKVRQSPDMQSSNALTSAFPITTVRHLSPLPGSTPTDWAGNNHPVLANSPIISSMSGSPLFMPQYSRQMSNWSMSSDDEIMNREFQSSSPLQFGNPNALMKTKYGRLQTFLTWPQDAMIQPQELAEAGFYYTKEDDGVKCHVCKVSLKNWEMGDTAWGEHKRWSPNCSLVKEHDGTASGHVSNTGNSQRGRRQIERVPHNIYKMGMPSVPLMPPFQAGIPSGIYMPPGGQFSPLVNSNMAIIGHNNIVQPPITYTQHYPPELQENSEGLGEGSQQEEQVGPLTGTDIDSLLDAGFTVDAISKVQKLQLEKHGVFFDSVDTIADAIMYFLETGSLDGHLSPCKKQSVTERPELNHKKVDLKRELDKVREMQLCKICMDEQVGTAFHPCGHLFSCPKCSVGMQQCPICRSTIESTSRVYLS